MSYASASTAASGVSLHSARTRMTSPQDRERPAPTAHASDLSLVRRAASGNALAVAELVQRLECIPAMLRELHRRYGAPLASDELAEIEQNTLAVLWSKLVSFEGRAALETWSYRFVRHELLKAFERRDRNRRSVVDGAAVLARVPQAEPREPEIDPGVLSECIERVGSPAADVIRMRHFDELGFEDIAMRCGEPLGTIKARYYRGLERLKELVAPFIKREQG